MIMFPETEQQWKAMASFVQHYTNVIPAAENKYLGWVEEENGETHIKMCVCFNNFMGHTCEIHVAMTNGYKFTPKAMLRETFQLAFDGFKRKMLIGIVKSENTEAMRFDQHLGFEEKFRFEGMSKDNGDIVILTMTPEQCKYYKPHEPNDMKVEPYKEEAA